MSQSYTERFHPSTVTDHPDFKVLGQGEPIYNSDINLACAYNEKKEIHLVQRPRPRPGKGEAVVHVRACGICGSDCHFWQHGRIGSMKVEGECTAGHESSGEIIELGSGCDGWTVGDRVAIEAGVPCGDCSYCRIGRYNACPDVVFFSTPPYHGTLTRYHLHPVKWLHKLPDEVSFEEGALLEPLVVALAAIERANIRLGDPLLIAGAGPIGLVTLLAAHAAGATPIVLTDLSASRLAFAQTLVPSVRTVVVTREDSAQELSVKIKKAAGTGTLLMHAIEATGVESSVQAAILSLSFGGVVMIVGLGKDTQSFPVAHMSSQEIDVKYLFRYANCYPRGIRLVSAGLINLKPLVTHRFTLEQAVAAFHTAVDPSKGSIKCQILDKAL